MVGVFHPHKILNKFLIFSKVDQYFSSLPPQEVPKLGSRGENTRLQRIVKQLPKQDLALSACKYVEDSARNSFQVNLPKKNSDWFLSQDFISARNEIALDIGLAKPAPPNSICENCKRTIPNQQIGVVAPRMGELIWHPACFQCSTCKSLLVDLAYCVHEEKIYCERHYAELLKPRCEGCDEVGLRKFTKKLVASLMNISNVHKFPPRLLLEQI